MRLDKYLKVARVLKRRSVSKELADQERVIVNGRKAKPSTEIKVNDVITVHFGNRELTIKVLDTMKQASKKDAALLFEVLDEKRIKKVEESTENPISE